MATKKLVPRANNEGGIGTAAKTWGASFLQNLTITNLQTTTSSSVLVETSGGVEKRAYSTFLPNLQSLDEGSSLTSTTASIDFVGAGVTATASGNDVTVTITGAAPVADTDDTTCWVALYEDASGTLLPKTDEVFKFNAHDGSQALYVPRIYANTNTTSAASDLDLYGEAAISGGPTNAEGGHVNLRGASGTGTGASGGAKIYATRPTTSGTSSHSSALVATFSHVDAATSDFRLWDPASVSPTDVFTISTGANGATSISTIDAAASNGHISFKPDGDMKHNPSSGIHRFYKASNFDDSLRLTIGDHGQATFETIDAASTGADILIKADGDFTLDAVSHIQFKLNGSAAASIESMRRENFTIALSDEVSVLSAGTNKATFLMPYAFTLETVVAYVTTVSTSGAITVDINEKPLTGASNTTFNTGATILSTKITIDQDENTSTTAATAPVISDTSIAANSLLTFDIDGAGTGAKGLKVTLLGYQTP